MPSAAPARFPWLSRDRLLLTGLLLFTALVRGGVLWTMRDKLQDDPDAYREIAENLLWHGVYGLGKEGKPPPTAYRPPLYPIVLSNLSAADGRHVSLAKVAVLHVLLGVATVWLTWLTARRLGSPTLRVGQVAGKEYPSRGSNSATENARFPYVAHTECGPALAALLVACDPILLNQQALVMTETLATFLAILALWCLVRFSAKRTWWHAGLAGGAIGLAALCRPTFLPWLGLVGAAMILDFGFWILDWRQWLGRALPNVITLVVAAAAVMSPWVIRNQQVFGKPIVTTTHGGYTLYLGNNKYFYEWLRTAPGDLPWDSTSADVWLQLMIVWEISPPPQHPIYSGFADPDLDTLESMISEPRSDEVAYDLARKAMRNDPKMLLVASLYRLRQLWSPLPHKLTADESTGRMLLRYATAAWYCGVYLLAAIGVWRLWWKSLRQPWLWGVLLCFTFTAVHTLYWCNLRMRAPLMPFVALVAAAGVGRVKLASGPELVKKD